MKTENGYLKILAKMHEKREREKICEVLLVLIICVCNHKNIDFGGRRKLIPTFRKNQFRVGLSCSLFYAVILFVVCCYHCEQFTV